MADASYVAKRRLYVHGKLHVEPGAKFTVDAKIGDSLVDQGLAEVAESEDGGSTRKTTSRGRKQKADTTPTGEAATGDAAGTDGAAAGDSEGSGALEL